MKRYLLVGCMALTNLAVQAQNNDSVQIRKMSDYLMNGKVGYEQLRFLTKSIGPRLSGSDQIVLAEHWAAKELKNLGADTVYRQQCMVPHWERGEKEIARVQPTQGKPYELNVLALGHSVGTGKSGIRAEVICVQNFAELEARKAEVKGKIVFYNYPWQNKFNHTFEGYGDAVIYRRDGAVKAAQLGAVGVLMRSVTHAEDNHPHTGTLRYEEGVPQIAAFALGVEDAVRLQTALQNDPKLKVFMRSTSVMKPDTIAHNIIGEIRGSVFPDQYITVGAHLDSWDNCEGAHDDGAGVVQSMAVLDAFKKTGIRPRHTIRIVLFANEENGARGASKYAEVAVQKQEKHVFAIESDAGAFTPRGFFFLMEDAKLQKIKSWIPLFKPYDIYEFDLKGTGVDIGPLHRALQTPAGQLYPDMQRYFEVHHAVSDTFETVSKRELNMGSVAMSALIYLIDKYGL
jgi:carboxypeptidase Q